MSAASEVESVVVPAIGTAGSLSAVRSLGRHGLRVICVSEDSAPPSFSSRYCAETRSVPSPSSNLSGYRDALLDLAHREDVGTIIPVRESDVHVLATNRATFAEHIGTPWPKLDTLQAVHDRIRLFEAAERAGVAIPETDLLTEIRDWDRERIVKGRHALLTETTGDAVPVNTTEAPPKTTFLEPGVEPDVDGLVAEMGHVPIAQEYVKGTEYCLRGLYTDGDVKVTSQKKLIRGYKYARGPSIYHQAVDIPALQSAGVALLDELEWEGLASVGFIRDHSGTFKLLEVNPRVPASMPVDIHAGINYPVYLWDLATAGAVDISPTYRSGVASHLLRGEGVHLHSVLFEDYALAEKPSVLGTAWNIASSLITQPHFDYLSLDDPAPFVRDALNATQDLVTRI